MGTSSNLVLRIPGEIMNVCVCVCLCALTCWEWRHHVLEEDEGVVEVSQGQLKPLNLIPKTMENC